MPNSSPGRSGSVRVTRSSCSPTASPKPGLPMETAPAATATRPWAPWLRAWRPPRLMLPSPRSPPSWAASAPASRTTPPCWPLASRPSRPLSDGRHKLEYMSENSSLTEVFIASGGPGTGPPPVVPLERLEAQICELAGHLTAATCRFLLLVGDFDARRGWESWELPSCGAWLAWKCQLAPGTAREQVRVARALRDLPVIRSGFAAGRLSYAKVRALTRIATPATEEGLAELAGPMTGGQLERFARAHRRVSRACGQQSRAARRVTWRIHDEDR